MAKVFTCGLSVRVLLYTLALISCKRRTMAVRNLEKRRCYSQMMSVSMDTKTAPIHTAAGKKSA